MRTKKLLQRRSPLCQPRSIARVPRLKNGGSWWLLFDAGGDLFQYHCTETAEASHRLTYRAGTGPRSASVAARRTTSRQLAQYSEALLPRT
jgi:hypothetical protein